MENENFIKNTFLHHFLVKTQIYIKMWFFVCDNNFLKIPSLDFNQKRNRFDFVFLRSNVPEIQFRPLRQRIVLLEEMSIKNAILWGQQLLVGLIEM